MGLQLGEDRLNVLHLEQSKACVSKRVMLPLTFYLYFIFYLHVETRALLIYWWMNFRMVYLEVPVNRFLGQVTKSDTGVLQGMNCFLLFQVDLFVLLSFCIEFQKSMPFKVR